MMNFFMEPTKPSHDTMPVMSELDQKVDVREEVSQTIGAMLPWSVSILFHLAIILFAFFLGFAILQIEEEPKPTEAKSITPPTSDVVVKKNLDQRTSSSRSRQRNAPQPEAPKLPPLDPMDAPFAPIGPVGFSPLPLNPGVGTAGDGLFGDGQINGEHPERIAFVIDASGSLIDTFPFVISELKRKLLELDSDHQVAIIFYADDRVIEVPPFGLTTVTPRNKKQLIDWVDVSHHNIVPRGTGDPVSAIQRALSYEPQLIYLLSDNITGRGKYAIDQQTLLDEIRRANRSQTVISTIQYIYEDALALAPGPYGLPAGEKARTLYKIAEMTGGEHAFVRAEDLKIR